MPVHLGSRMFKENEARIEIVPLIDIMFFLLASFMLVSLSMVNLNAVKVDLPTATSASEDSSRNLISLSVDKGGMIFLEKTPVGANQLSSQLQAIHSANPEARVFISGDREASHGDVLRALDLVRSAGIEQVAFEVRAEDGSR